MKLDLLFLESDVDRRRTEREWMSDENPAAEEKYLRSQMRSSGSIPVPRKLTCTPSKGLKVHKERFNGRRWPEFEDLILNYKRTQSFEKRRTGIYTYPTQVAAKYALQIDEPWPEFLPLAEHMLNFLGIFGGYRPNYSSTIMPIVLMIAQYLVKHNLNPSWASNLYTYLVGILDNINDPFRHDPETGYVGTLNNGEAEIWTDEHGHHEFPSGRGNLNDTTISRILPDLKKVVGA